MYNFLIKLFYLNLNNITVEIFKHYNAKGTFYIPT